MDRIIADFSMLIHFGSLEILSAIISKGTDITMSADLTGSADISIFGNVTIQGNALLTSQTTDGDFSGSITLPYDSELTVGTWTSLPGTVILDGGRLTGSGEVGNVIALANEIPTFYTSIRGTLTVQSSETRITIESGVFNAGGVAVDTSGTELGSASVTYLQLGYATEGDVLLTAVGDRLYLDPQDRLEGRVFFGEGDDLFSSKGSSLGRILAGHGNDTIAFLNDSHFGTEATHTGRIFLQSGDDLATGALPSPNQIYGGPGNDTITGGRLDDRLYGQGDDDSLSGFEGADKLDGGPGADVIDGGDDPDTLIGGPGEDTIDAGHGGDRVWAGPGADDVRGGFGPDVFVIRSLDEIPVGPSFDQIEVIRDFEDNNDVIQLTRIDADTTTPGDQAFEFVSNAAFSGTPGELRFERIGMGTLVELDVDGDRSADGHFLISGYPSLNASDFLL